MYNSETKTITGLTAKGNEFTIGDVFAGEDTPTVAVTKNGANVPDIDGFKKSTTSYVTWASDTAEPTATLMSEKTEEQMGNWYNYSTTAVEGAVKNQWANVKTSGGAIGAENDCYWVWIPRYAYKIPDASSAGTIQVAFLSGTGTSTDDIIDTDLKATIKAEGGFKTNTDTYTVKKDDWVVHPAFTFGDKELSGIWVAKFEASSSAMTGKLTDASQTQFNSELANTTIYGGSSADTDLQVRVVPNVVSWRHITVNNIFTVCKALTNEGNSLYEATGADPHMMKNTEWGAVAYLSRSQYGKNEKVANNNYYHSNSYASITGVTTNSDTAVTVTGTLSKYNSDTGVNASTSGNVYGVYDMAGGVWEYTAAYINNFTANSSTNISNLRIAENAKYREIYEARTDTDTVANTTGSNNDVQANNYKAAINKYGDAVYETSINGDNSSTSWDTDYSYFPSTTGPVFSRGGHASNGSNAGVFAFYRNSGGVGNSYGFRPVVVFPQ